MLNIAARNLFRSARPVATPGRHSFNYVARSLMTLKEVKYTTTATASGLGRNGEVECDGLKLKLATPKELGGTGDGENPEQLFAMGYSACFLGALQLVARQQGKAKLGENAVVHASVSLGIPNERPGFGLAVDIKVEGVDDELVKAAHEACPYSRALVHGAVVNVSKA